MTCPMAWQTQSEDPVSVGMNPHIPGGVVTCAATELTTSLFAELSANFAAVGTTGNGGGVSQRLRISCTG